MADSAGNESKDKLCGANEGVSGSEAVSVRGAGMIGCNIDELKNESCGRSVSGGDSDAIGTSVEAEELIDVVSVETSESVREDFSENERGESNDTRGLNVCGSSELNGCRMEGGVNEGGDEGGQSTTETSKELQGGMEVERRGMEVDASDDGNDAGEQGTTETGGELHGSTEVERREGAEGGEDGNEDANQGEGVGGVEGAGVEEDNGGCNLEGGRSGEDEGLGNFLEGVGLNYGIGAGVLKYCSGSKGRGIISSDEAVRGIETWARGLTIEKTENLIEAMDTIEEVRERLRISSEGEVDDEGSGERGVGPVASTSHVTYSDGYRVATEPISDPEEVPEARIAIRENSCNFSPIAQIIEPIVIEDSDEGDDGGDNNDDSDDDDDDDDDPSGFGPSDRYRDMVKHAIMDIMFERRITRDNILTEDDITVGDLAPPPTPPALSEPPPLVDYPTTPSTPPPLVSEIEEDPSPQPSVPK